jgi:hypothetical protein
MGAGDAGAAAGAAGSTDGGVSFSGFFLLKKLNIMCAGGPAWSCRAAPGIVKRVARILPEQEVSSGSLPVGPPGGEQIAGSGGQILSRRKTYCCEADRGNTKSISLMCATGKHFLTGIDYESQNKNFRDIS